MSSPSIMKDLPAYVYNENKRQAEKHRRTIEAEIKAALTKFVVGENEDENAEENGKLSPELQKLVDQLPFLDQSGLTRLAKSTFLKKKLPKLNPSTTNSKVKGLQIKKNLI